MVHTHSFRPEALRGKRLAQGHPASGDREIPALTRASKAQHPLGGWGGGFPKPRTRNQHHGPHPKPGALVIRAPLPPAHSPLACPTSRRLPLPPPRSGGKGFLWHPPPHTLSSLAAHLPRREQQMPPRTAVPSAEAGREHSQRARGSSALRGGGAPQTALRAGGQ